MGVLQEEALLRQQDVQTNTILLAGLQNKIRPLLQQSINHEHIVSTAQVRTRFILTVSDQLFIYTIIKQKVDSGSADLSVIKHVSSVSVCVIRGL